MAWEQKKIIGKGEELFPDALDYVPEAFWSPSSARASGKEGVSTKANLASQHNGYAAGGVAGGMEES
jgi:hypothetical protein